MATLRSQLLSRREIAERTMTFEFEKPPGFSFVAGQALEITLRGFKKGDEEGMRRTFSIASAPAGDRLEIATRLRDTAFKQALQTMPLGSPVDLDGPFGSMTLHKDASRPAVFVAGGIGITPFMSILRQAAVERPARSFILLTSNRRPEDAPYLDELEDLAKSVPGLQFVGTMTKLDDSSRSWPGHYGRITTEFITETVWDIKGAVCYAAGPPALVAAMKRVLLEAGADGDSLRTEDFAGY